MTEKDETEAKLFSLFETQIDELNNEQFSNLVMKKIEKKSTLRKQILSILAFISLFVVSVLTYFSGIEISSFFSLSHQTVTVFSLFTLTVILSFSAIIDD